jgi:hypothetical protein
LLSASNGLVNYQWYRNNALLAGANSGSFYAMAPGRYKCEAADSNGCTGISNTVQVRITCIPIGPNHDKAVQPFSPTTLEAFAAPNPSSEGFLITVNCESMDEIRLTVYTGSGQLVRNASWERKPDGTFMLEKLPAGFYFAEITCGELKDVVKLIQTD